MQISASKCVQLQMQILISLEIKMYYGRSGPVGRVSDS